VIKTKVAFLEGWLLSSQSEQYVKVFKKLWLAGKSRPSKKATFLWSCKQAVKSL